MAKEDQLQTSFYFQTPIYHIEIPEWVDHVDKVCDKYVKDARKRNQKAINKRKLRSCGRALSCKNLSLDKKITKR